MELTFIKISIHMKGRNSDIPLTLFYEGGGRGGGRIGGGSGGGSTGGERR